MSLISASEIKVWIGAGYDGTSEDDSSLEALCDRMVDHISTLTGRYFGTPAEFEEVFDGKDSLKLWLRNPPVDGVLTSCETRLSVDSDWEALVAGTDYEVRGRKIIRKGGYVWPDGCENIRVVYEAGYTSSNIPSDILQAVYELIESAWRNRVIGTPLLGAEQTIDIPRTVGSTISRWRVIAGAGTHANRVL